MNLKLNNVEKKVNKLIDSTFKHMYARFEAESVDIKLNFRHLAFQGRTPLQGLSFPIKLSVYYMEFNPDVIATDFDIDYVEAKNIEKLDAKIKKIVGFIGQTVTRYKERPPVDVESTEALVNPVETKV